MTNTKFEMFTLPNGLRCIHRRPCGGEGMAVAHIALTIDSGTRDESELQHGVAHLVEHMMFKGTTKRSAYKVNSMLENAGGELNAFTAKEETVVHATILRSEFTKATDLLSDMVFNSRFDSKELDKEREVIIDEINSYKDSPAELIFDDFEKFLFTGSTLGRNVLGSERNLKLIKREQLVRYIKSRYTSDRMVFSASVDMSHGKFRTICEKYLGHLSLVNTDMPLQACRRKRLVRRVRTAPVRQPVFEIIKHKNTYQTHCVIGGYGYDLHDKKRILLAFLINLLGGPLSVSRLNMQLREKHALTYNVEAGYMPYSDSGIYTIYLGCDKDKLERAISLVRKELQKLCDTKLTSSQLSAAKKQFIGQLSISSENTEGLMLGIAKSVLVYNAFDSMAEIAIKIDAVTAEELLETANEIFCEDNIFTLIYQ